MRRKLAAGNWKMNGLGADLDMLRALAEASPSPKVDLLICPPATLISRATDMARGTSIAIGAQDCHAQASGAHTGDISAEMLSDAGARYVILGHSERRTDHAETNALVRAKTQTAWAHGLTAIVCVGEQLSDRKAGQTLDIVAEQVSGSLPDKVNASQLVIAYEPVWAIGTGLVPTHAEIGEVHTFLRAQLADRFGPTAADAIPLLYGGSVKGSNAAEVFSVPHVDGALVGGASLTAKDFLSIVKALEAA